MSGSDICWSCEQPLYGSDICPNCRAAQKDKNEEDDLDSFLDSALSATSSEEDGTQDDQEFSLPDMEYVEGKSEKSSNISSELDADSKEQELDISLPDMDYVGGRSEVSTNISSEIDEIPSAGTDEFDLPDMDYVEGKSEISPNLSSELDTIGEFKGKVTEEEKEDLLSDLDALMEAPTTPESTKVVAEEEAELEIEPVSEIIAGDDDLIKPKLRDIGFRRILWLFGTQYLYWILIFFLITAGSLEISSQNISVPNPSADAYEILPEGYIISWFSFMVMGFFLSYKIRQYNLIPKLRYAVIFMIGFTSLFILLMQIGLYYFNPEVFSGIYDPYYYLPTLYFYLGWINFLAYFFSAGILFFIIGYGPMFRSIYSRMPMYELQPELVS